MVLYVALSYITLMKRKYIILLFAAALSFSTTTSCKTGYGCESTEKYKANTNKRGELSKKGGNTNLFSKKKRKKVRS